MSLLTLSKRVLGKGDTPKKKKGKQEKSSDKKAFQSVPGTDVKAGKKTAGTKKKAKQSESVVVSVRASKIGLTPIITESSMTQQQQNVVVFKVRPEATKHQIKLAVKEKFGVQPLSVRTASFAPKARRRGQTVGKTSYWKKAYVQVEDIQKLTTTP